MTTPHTPPTATEWLRKQGAPLDVARAFGDYHTGCIPGTPFTAAKLRFERQRTPQRNPS